MNGAGRAYPERASAPLRWADASTAATECHRARVADGDYLVLRSRVAPDGLYLARKVVGFHHSGLARGPFPTLAAAKTWCEAHHLGRTSPPPARQAASGLTRTGDGNI